MKNKIFENVLFLICLFPYLSFLDTSFDMQPYALMCGLLFVLLGLSFGVIKKIPHIIIIYIYIFIYALTWSLLSNDFFNSLRSLVGYLSVAVFSLGGYYSIKYVNSYFFRVSVYIWFIVGLIQNFINRDFANFILPRIDTSDDRGITSLAVEPSAYAVICIFFLLLNDLFKTRGDYSNKQHILLEFVIFLQLFLARSALGFVILLLYLFFKALSKKDFRSKLINLLLIFASLIPLYLIFSRFQLFQESRVAKLIGKMDEGVLGLILRDGSTADRLSHVIISFKSLFYSYGIGFGMDSWKEIAPEIVMDSSVLIQNITSVNFTYGRIMSGWGSTIFELGIVGILFVSIFVYIGLKGISKKNIIFRRNYIVMLPTIFFVMLMSVTISFPLFGYFVGIMIYYNTYHEKIGNDDN